MLDAAFLRRAERDEARVLAASLGLAFSILAEAPDKRSCANGCPHGCTPRPTTGSWLGSVEAEPLAPEESELTEIA